MVPYWAMVAGSRKIPVPMMDPTTSAVAAGRPRLADVVSEGVSGPSGGIARLSAGDDVVVMSFSVLA